MPYQKKDIVILAGGLNLVLPGDRIDDSEAQQLVNFSFDNQGALVSRKGHKHRFSAPGRVVNMVTMLGSVWAASTGGTVSEDGRSLSVSGDHVGLVGWKNFAWGMSVGGQRKTDGTNDWPWIMDPPTKSPTAAAEAEAAVVLADMGPGFTVDPSGDEDYSTGSLRIVASKAQAYTAVKKAGGDFATGFTLDDVFKIRVHSNRFSNINSLTWDVDVNDGTFTTDYYTATMLASDLHAGTKDTLTIYLRKRPSDTDTQTKDKFRYGYFNRVGQTPGKDWSTVAAVRLKVDFNDVARIRWDSWEMVGNSGQAIQGDNIQYCETFISDAGHESNPGPFSNAISVVRGGVDITSLEDSSDSQTTHKNIYRRGGTLGSVYLVKPNTIANGVSEYKDGAGDDDLTNLDIVLEDDHDPVPQVGGLAGPFFDRLIAFGNNQIFWSHQNKPYAFAGARLLTGDWVSPEDDIGTMHQATKRQAVLWIHASKGVGILQGDPGGFASFHRAAADSGIQSPTAVAQAPEGDYVNMADGIYLFTGEAAAILSKKIDPVFTGSTWNAATAAVGQRRGVVWASDGGQTYKLDTTTGRWMQDSRVFACFYNDSTALLGALTTGEIVELDSVASDEGAISLLYHSKAYDAGIVDNDKRWDDVTIWANTGGNSLTCTALFNDGSEDAFGVALGTITSGSEDRVVFQCNGDKGVFARTCAILIEGTDGVGGHVSITKIVLNLQIQAREAKSFDSGEMDFGTSKAKEVRKVWVDMLNSSPANLTVQTDQPGFTLLDRDTAGVFAANATRREDLYVLPVDQIGHNLRFLLNSLDMHMYGLRALIQEIGTLLHGSRGDFYDSDPISQGIENVKLYRWVECLYASNAAAVLHIYCGLATTGMRESSLSPFTLPSTGGIFMANLRTIKFKLAGNDVGRLIRALIVPSGDFRLEELRFDNIVVGTTSPTGWQWSNFPVEGTAPGPGRWADVYVGPDEPG